MDVVALAAGLVFGVLLGWLIAQTRSRARFAEFAEKTGRLEAELTQARENIEQQKKMLDRAGEEFQNAFKALAADALKSNNQSFLQLARETFAREQAAAKGELEKKEQAVESLVRPLSESLAKVDQKIVDLEKAREQAYGALREQMKLVDSVQRELRDETGKLVKALRAPIIRGRWGEIQLRRVVEMAGLIDHVDFTEQESVTTETGRLRPDVIVKLPGGKQVVVDAKTPLAAYLEAVEAPDDEARQLKMRDHARQVHDHIVKLSAKSYWSQFEPAPEFVVMFLPGEDFFSEALRQDPTLIEQGVDQRVIMATPTTLIALLRAVSYGWQQETVARSAREISELGKVLYERIRVLGGHFAGIGKNLDKAVESYNKSVGALESRVLVQARRFAELGSGGANEIPAPQPVEKTARVLQAPDLVGDDQDAGDEPDGDEAAAGDPAAESGESA